jgi:signal peptidase II
MRQTKRILLLLLVLAGNYAADRITKLLAVRYLDGEAPKEFFGRLMVLQYAENDGAFLGLGGAFPLPLKLALFIAIPLAACAAGLFWAFRPSTKLSLAICAVSIIAGGLGNLQDRIMNDFRVVDFLNFGLGPVRTGILNVADLSVTFGTLALLLLDSRMKREINPKGS